MHVAIQAATRSSALAEEKVIDPVYRMTIEPATAAAREMFDSKPVYFRSEGCRHRFLANPAAYAGAAAEPWGTAATNAARSQSPTIDG